MAPRKFEARQRVQVVAYWQPSNPDSGVIRTDGRVARYDAETLTITPYGGHIKEYTYRWGDIREVLEAT